MKRNLVESVPPIFLNPSVFINNTTSLVSTISRLPRTQMQSFAVGSLGGVVRES